MVIFYFLKKNINNKNINNKNFFNVYFDNNKFAKKSKLYVLNTNKKILNNYIKCINILNNNYTNFKNNFLINVILENLENFLKKNTTIVNNKVFIKNNNLKKNINIFDKIQYLNNVKNFFKLNNLNYNNLKVIYKNYDLDLYNNKEKIKILFLRKNKIFNKGRYSRNRQIYRTGVYLCLWINILMVYGLYYIFYKIIFNFNYLWFIFINFIFLFIFIKIFKYNLFSFKNIFKEINLLINWYCVLFNNLINIFIFLEKKFTFLSIIKKKIFENQNKFDAKFIDCYKTNSNMMFF